jgi:hypothetical protein
MDVERALLSCMELSLLKIVVLEWDQDDERSAMRITGGQDPNANDKFSLICSGIKSNEIDGTDL